AWFPVLRRLSCGRVAGHQIADARGTGNAVRRLETAEVSRGPVARMALCPSRHELGRDDEPAQAAARKARQGLFAPDPGTRPQAGPARPHAEISLAAPRPFAHRKRSDSRQPRAL